jgi:protein TonB
MQTHSRPGTRALIRDLTLGTACALLLSACGFKGWSENEARSGAPLGSSKILQWDSTQFDVGPRRLSGDAPIYPFSASMANQPGVAVVRFTIGEDGKTRDIIVVRASAPYFGAHTAYAIKHWVFEPARKNGRPVAVTVEQENVFYAPDGHGPDLAASSPKSER